MITTSADGAYSVFAIDMDGDGDVDVLSASYDDDTVAWYENLDGSGGSFSTHVITTSADGASRCSRSTWTATATWTCSRPLTRRHGRVVREPGRERRQLQHARHHHVRGRCVSVFAIDMDGDGDVDVLSASVSDDTVAWYENIGRNQRKRV